MKPWAREEGGAWDWTLANRAAIELQHVLLGEVRGGTARVDLNQAIMVWWSPSRMLYRVEFSAYTTNPEFVYTQEPTLLGVLWAIIKGLKRG